MNAGAYDGEISRAISAVRVLTADGAMRTLSNEEMRFGYRTSVLQETGGVVLSAENRRQLFIPRGFAHGFLVLSDTAEFCYKCDDVYHPNDEGGLMWNDPALGVEWPLLPGVPLNLSQKDTKHPSFQEYKAARGL